jgi:glutaredoxin 3
MEKTMANITIYTTRSCGFCYAAKSLLTKKGLSYDEIDVSADPAARQRMMLRTNGRRSVPQIFVGETHVGGNEDLYELERRGGLDPLLMAT